MLPPDFILTVTVFDITWLKFSELLTFNIGFPHNSDFGNDAYRYFYGQLHGSHIFVRLYARREGLPALLRIPESLHNVNARTRCGNQHIPNVSFLGASRCKLLSAYRFLLSAARSCRCFKEGVYSNTFCRFVLPYRYPVLQLLCRNIQL